ncbi:DUF4382 domain-containing protein [Ideonella sp.]|uniref:DUF4382 domain-containing protein n=1 Tax=Ideonella sp. TaxID=1929293 RepID=UPI002B48BDF0|nr:DUF4382 domain-containing protein [Ideonella sp.]HJV68617.1 DUF4382 domain-containing protein [Ideonella sp.]
MKLQRMVLSACAALGLLLAGCGGGSGGGGGGIGGTGVMRVSLTDAPACGYDEVNVTIDRIRVNQSADAGDNDAGWTEIVMNPAKRVDLLTLQNGIVEALGETPLPAGKYTQLRLVLVDNSQAQPLANSVIPTGEAETELHTPSGQQSGLKVNMDVDVAEGQAVDVVLDFDACRSVVKAGNSGRYNLKPVITATPMLTTAGQGVVGYLDPAIALPSTLVSVQQGGVVVKATAPDLAGKFVLYPVPAGNYELVVSAEGRATAVMTGVPVDTVAVTNVSTAVVPIVPSVAAFGTASVAGTVTPATATVRALQSFNGGPTVEVQYAAVDALSGAFSFTLPLDPPESTVYVAAPTSISFSADLTATGLYTIEAASGGVVKTQAIDAKLPVPPMSFTFP